MTQEEKALLLHDLCARLPYGFTIYRNSDNRDITFNANKIDDFSHFLEYSEGEEFKPYLRPMSSMTEEERTKLEELDAFSAELGGHIPTLDSFDYLNSIHVDYRGLIYKGLALEAPEGMYNLNKE